ncbi:serine/arginine repetitive matrix protein 2-like isoform X2 [Mytilus californianus]|uniref:serine/arginine repetitive matrix protein 2-like isoform X2 n=1 Tax=Mytilus californianus TaxID=6549 RepID=UPI002247E2A5|nr:serine/arginine repetitive matrix protein 2-like isoform X2 [Mytilus californianus]
MNKPPIPQTPRNRSPSPAVGHNYGTTYLDAQDRTAKYRRSRPASIIIRKSASQSNISQQSPTRCESPSIVYGTPRRSTSQSGMPHSQSKRSPSPGMSPQSPTARSPSPAMLPQSPRARSPSPALLPQSPRSSSPSVTQQVQRIRSSTPSLLEKLLRKTKETWGYDGGTSKLESSVKVLRSSSFLQKAREAQERERNRLGIQDDSIVQKQSSSSMKQRPRRIESFHGSRTRRYDKTPSVSSSTEGSIQSYQTAESRELRESATVQNEKGDNQLPMEQATTPTTKQVKEWPTMADLSQKQILPNKYDGNQGYFNPHLSPSKSSPSLDKEEPHHVKTGNYTSPLMNKSSPNIHDDVKKSTPSSSSSSSYLANQKWFSPSAFQKQSPRQYHSSNNFYQSSPQFTKHNPNDYQNLQDIQQSINQPNVMSYNLPTPVEKEESDPELQGLTKGDNRPLCSPPAPPTRDISSLKYVPLSNQSHAKYPSWPVTQPSADIESGEPINAPLSLLNEHNPNQNNVRALKDRNSPNSERKASDRNASDPGFKKPIPFAVFLKRPDQRHQQYGSHVQSDRKDTDSKMNEFFESLPGYQQPIFDQDGHRFGDEKYNVSPPERESDGRYPSQRVSNKTTDNRYTPQYRIYQEPVNSSRITRDSGSNPLLSPDKDSKPSFSDLRYSDKSLLQVTPDNKFTDSSTSPMQSPKDSKLPHGSKDNYPDNVQTSIYDPKNNSYLVKKTMVCYTTGTQTEFNSPRKKSPSSPGYNMHFPFDKSNQAIQTSPENTNKDDDFVRMRKSSRDRHEESYESRPRPKSTSEKDKILLNNINSELDSNDQHSAPFMRKLARDLLANQSQEHKRRSTSSSGGSGLRSPSSDYSHYFGELRESGSYSSVIIHDDLSEAESATSSKPDGTYDSEKQHLHQFEKLKSPRRSLDPSMFSQKLSSRGLQNSRYGSEAQLVNQSHKDHTSSMINLPRSAREDSRPKFSRPSTDSSTPSHKTGSSTDTFSSTSTHYSFDTSPGPYVPGIPGPTQHSTRRESNDSVFVDEKSPFEKKGDNFKDFKSQINNDKKSKTTAWVGRTQSMKKAYGVYDETHSLIHKRQESEVSSSSSENHQFIHSRSQSDTNYLPMNEIRSKQNSDKMLGAINEETSEARWQDALRKSKSREISYEQNISELDVKKHVNEKLREYQNKTEMERTNLKRTSSEQFRPMKERMANKTHSESKLDEPKQHLLPNKDLDMRQAKVTKSNSREKISQSPSQSQTDLRSPSSSDSSRRSSDRLPSPSSSRLDLRPDSNSGSDKKSPSPSSSRADLVGSRDDLKRAQKNALQNFMLTKTGRLPSDEEEKLHQHQNNGNGQSQPDRPTRLSVTESFRKKYAEGDKLRRSRSISSTDSGNYTEMRPPMRPQPTEWSRMRSQTRRPQSIGSDSGSSLVDPYAVTPVISSSFDHQRSDSLESPRVEEMSKDLQSSGDTTPHSPRMGSSNIYQNLMPEHPGYRKPPPPPPPSEEEKPPELPPRNYRPKDISQSDSQLRQQRYLPPQEESHEQYAEQLRKFSRRYSEQSSASMMYLSSKTQTHITQSFPKPEVKSLEATSPITSHSPPSSISAETTKMSTSQFVPQQQPSYSASFTQPTSQTKNVSPSSSHHQSPSSSSFDISNEKLNDSRHLQPSPRQSPPMSRNRQPSPQQHSPPPSVLRQISSPDPPPPPTPIKEGVEFNQELPPPPPEILNTLEQKPDGFSDDSYLAHKSKGETRQIGTYKRSSTTGDVSKLPSETNNNKVEIQKPPRKRLLQQAWQPQTSQPEISEHSNEQSSVPRFSASESRVNPNVVKSVAKPLEKNHVQQRPLGSSYSASALLTPRPFSSTAGTSQKDTHSHSADREERTSVRDQIFSYEKKATPRRPDRFNSPKLIPRSPSNINSSRSHVDQMNDSNGFDSTRRPSNENLQQSELQNNLSNSVHEGSSRLSLDSDPSKYSSPRRTSNPPEKHKINFIGRYGNDGDQERKNLSHSDFNGDVKLSLRSQDNHQNESFILPNNSGDKGHSYRHSNRSSDHDTHNVNKSHMSFTPNHEQHPAERKGLVEKGHNSARDQELQVCHVRQRSQEELECDKKVSEIVKKDESLKQVLKVDNKGRMDFMNGLFPLDEPVRLHHSPHHSPQSSSVNEDKHIENDRRTEEQKSPLDTSALPADYFKSSPKAKIEMDMRGKSDEFNQEMSKEIGDPDTLIKTKEELVRSIQKKVEKLKEEKSELQKELDEIDEVGQKLVEVVQQKGRTQQEKDKFSSYITDMEKIIKLLLKLSGLLARAENALQSLPDNSSPSTKKLAVDKRDRLRDQHEEAKSLKEDIDKRSAQVSIFLQDCLTDAEHEDYKYFVQMKSKLTIEMQEFEDKITLGQEQILGLKRNIPDK